MTSIILLINMAEINILPGAYENTQRFLATPTREAGTYFLVKQHKTFREGGGIIYSCGIHEISVVVGFEDTKTYCFVTFLTGTPGDKTALAGLEKVVAECKPPLAYCVQTSLKQMGTESGFQLLGMVFSPRQRVPITTPYAFGQHIQDFAAYLAEVLRAMIDSNYDWNVPRMELTFQSGQLEKSGGENKTDGKPERKHWGKR